jgi:hypothetical protein
LRLEKFVDLKTLNSKKAIGNQQISLRGWNYIEKENVGYLFDINSKSKSQQPKTKTNKVEMFKVILNFRYID